MPNKHKKSYRQTKGTSPLRNAIFNDTKLKRSQKDKGSFFSKIRSFLSWNQDFSSKTDEPNKLIEGTDSNKESIDKNKMVFIPGGFFNMNNSDLTSSSLVLSKKRPESSLEESSKVLSDDSNDSDTCLDINDNSGSNLIRENNSKLSDFFNEKGDNDISEIEMAGVIALMKQNKELSVKKRKISTSSSSNHLLKDSTKDNEDLDISKNLIILKNSNKKSFKPPNFNPEYEKNNDNLSIQKESQRRIFDYNTIPPYRTSIYSYNSSPIENNNVDTDTLSNNKTSTTTPLPDNELLQSSTTTKRVTNTASALLSLLNNDNDEEEDLKDISLSNKNLANPYGLSNKKLLAKREETLSEKEKPLFPSTTKSVPVDSSLLTNKEKEPVKPISTPIIPAFNEQTVDNENQQDVLDNKKPQQQNNLSSLFDTIKTNNNGVSTPSTTFDKYKPNRSSSLRSSVFTKEKSPEKITIEEQKKEKKPIQSSFTFSFDQPKKENSSFSPILEKQESNDTKAKDDTKTTPISLFPLKNNSNMEDKTTPKTSFVFTPPNNNEPKIESKTPAEMKPTFSFKPMGEINSTKNTENQKKPEFNFTPKVSLFNPLGSNDKDKIVELPDDEEDIELDQEENEKNSNNLDDKEKEQENKSEKKDTESEEKPIQEIKPIAIAKNSEIKKPEFNFFNKPAEMEIDKEDTEKKEEDKTLPKPIFSFSAITPINKKVEDGTSKQSTGVFAFSIPKGKTTDDKKIEASSSSEADNLSEKEASIDIVYDFGNVEPSNVDDSSIDNKKVEEFRNIFTF